MESDRKFHTEMQLANGVDSDGEGFVEMKLNGLPYSSMPWQAMKFGMGMIEGSALATHNSAIIQLLRDKGWPDAAIGEFLDEINHTYDQLKTVQEEQWMKNGSLDG